MPLPPPGPHPMGARRAPVRRKTRLHPQAKISRFWSKFNSRKPGKVTSIFPRKLYRGLAPSVTIPRGGTCNAVQSYEAARAECEAMVRRAVARCEQTNNKFTDFDFDIETDHWLGERNCLYGLERPIEDDSDSDDDEPSPDRVSRSWRTIIKSGILSSTVQFNVYQMQKYFGASNPRPDIFANRRRPMAPMAVHRVDWIFENPQFTINGYSSSDIKQGACGDCWWLVAVSNIAHRRDLMEKICVARDEDCGVYGFVFHRDGEWVPTVVDDNLYLKNLDFGLDNEVYDSRGKKARQWKKQKQTGSEALYFSKCEEENETWLPLLEKAYAKIHGDYDAIHGGWAGSGVEDLTGGVNNMILANRVLRKDRLWREMLTIDQDKGEFVFGLSATSDFRDLAGRKNGIVQSHAYSVLRAAEVEDEEGRKHRLIKMRNPWGQRADNGMGEWHGPWSDGSKEWTPHMIKQLQHEPADDGVFWMSFGDVLNNFKWIHRTRLFDETWTVAQQWTSENVAWVPGYLKSKFVVEVRKAGLHVIVLQKLDSRYFKGLEGRYWHYLEFVIRKSSSAENLAEAQGFPHSDRRSVNVEIYLEPGVYEIFPKVTSESMPWTESVETVVKREAVKNPNKLRQVGMQYDIAHAKAGVLDEDAEQERQGERMKRKLRQKKRKEQKISEMRGAMATMQAALTNMTKGVETKDQKKDKDKGKDNEVDSEQDRPDTGETAQVKDEPVPEDAKQPPGFWPDDSFRSSQGAGQGDSATKENKRIEDGNKQSKSTQTRDAPQQPGLEPAEPFTAPTSKPDPKNNEDVSDSSSDADSDTDSESKSDTDSDTNSDTDSDTDSVTSVQESENGDTPWNPVCVMCLRVYSQDKEVSVKLVRASSKEGGDVDADTGEDIQPPSSGSLCQKGKRRKGKLAKQPEDLNPVKEKTEKEGQSLTEANLGDGKEDKDDEKIEDTKGQNDEKMIEEEENANRKLKEDEEDEKDLKESNHGKPVETKEVDQQQKQPPKINEDEDGGCDMEIEEKKTAHEKGSIEKKELLQEIKEAQEKLMKLLVAAGAA